jgi:NADPH:quinone reductase-like Zn-dependent oxidoreductase
MKSVVLSNYNRNVLRAILSLEVTALEKPVPVGDEVLVKLHAAPVNPSDIAFIQGGYQIVKSLPAVPGFEGSGTVEGVASGLEDWLGKRVSFFVQDDKSGAWSDYLVVKECDLIELHEDMDMDQAACLAINPFTAYGLFDVTGAELSRAVIVNAAGGQVPAFIRSLAQEHDVKVINIVRSQVAFDKLKSNGEAYILLESEEGFAAKLKELAHDLEATIAFDAVAGAQSGVLFNAMPPDSELVLYGGLSNKPVSELSTMDLIFNDKMVSGFNLSAWKELIDNKEFEAISESIQKKFITGKWKTHIRFDFSFDQVTEALKSYLGDMSGGKVLLKSSKI